MPRRCRPRLFLSDSSVQFEPAPPMTGMRPATRLMTHSATA